MLAITSANTAEGETFRYLVRPMPPHGGVIAIKNGSSEHIHHAAIVSSPNDMPLIATLTECVAARFNLYGSNKIDPRTFFDVAADLVVQRRLQLEGLGEATYAVADIFRRLAVRRGIGHRMVIQPQTETVKINFESPLDGVTVALDARRAVWSIRREGFFLDSGIFRQGSDGTAVFKTLASLERPPQQHDKAYNAIRDIVGRDRAMAQNVENEMPLVPIKLDGAPGLQLYCDRPKLF